VSDPTQRSLDEHDFAGVAEDDRIEARVLVRSLVAGDEIASGGGNAESALAKQAGAAVAAFGQRRAVLIRANAAHARRAGAVRRHARPSTIGTRAATASAAVVATRERAHHALRIARHALAVRADFSLRTIGTRAWVAAAIGAHAARAGLARERHARRRIAALIRDAAATALERRRAAAALDEVAARIVHMTARARHVAALERDARAHRFVRIRVTELVVGARHARRTIERQPAAHRARHELGRVTTREQHENDH